MAEGWGVVQAGDLMLDKSKPYRVISTGSGRLFIQDGVRYRPNGKPVKQHPGIAEYKKLQARMKRHQAVGVRGRVRLLGDMHINKNMVPVYPSNITGEMLYMKPEHIKRSKEIMSIKAKVREARKLEKQREQDDWDELYDTSPF